MCIRYAQHTYAGGSCAQVHNGHACMYTAMRSGQVQAQLCSGARQHHHATHPCITCIAQ
jgi:hypothetical protein